MLSYILGLIQAFERSHGRVPMQVCLNTRHMQRLLDECPGLANSNESSILGFHIGILPEDSLSHPKVVLLSGDREAFWRGRPDHFSGERPSMLASPPVAAVRPPAPPPALLYECDNCAYS